MLAVPDFLGLGSRLLPGETFTSVEPAARPVKLAGSARNIRPDRSARNILHCCAAPAAGRITSVEPDPQDVGGRGGGNLNASGEEVSPGTWARCPAGAHGGAGGRRSPHGPIGSADRHHRG